MTVAIQTNTLYILTNGAFLRKEHETLEVHLDGACALRAPIRNIENVVAFGRMLVSPEAMRLCADFGVALAFLSESGRFIARVDAPGSGNVLLRRAQFRRAESDEATLHLAKCVVVGKLANARTLLLRQAREASAEKSEALGRAAARVAGIAAAVPTVEEIGALRGYEGAATRAYFSGLPFAIRQQTETFQFTGRTRRPPRDECNALLSFLYALVLSDCVAALEASGLDPSVGYLHEDRSGRPSLALDLMEEFRPAIADRLALALINLRQVSGKDFERREGGAVLLTEGGRRKVVTAYQRRKQEEVQHPFLGESHRLAQVFCIQARLLARAIRGELAAYPPYGPR